MQRNNALILALVVTQGTHLGFAAGVAAQSAPQAMTAARRDVPATAASARASTRSEPPPTAAPSARLLQDDRALVRWVMEHSPDVAASRADLEAARAVHRGSSLLPNPIVDVSVSNFALAHTYPSVSSPTRPIQVGAGLSELFELGKRGPRIAAAGLRSRAAEGRLMSTVADRVSAARLALAQLIYARARALELDASLAQARAAADVAKGRLDHQALSGVDYDRLLIDLAGIQTEAAHAHAEAEAAEAQCAATLLAPCDLHETSVNAIDPAASVPAAWDPARLDDRADVEALKLESSAATRDADLAAARAIPDLTFRLGYLHDSFIGPNTNSGVGDSLQLSVSAPIPIFDHGQYGKMEALANASQARDQARSLVTRARGDVASLFVRKRAVEASIDRLERDALPRANGVLASEERGLREGQLDITDLLLARREAITLRLQSLDLHFELFSVRNELRQALGLDEGLAQR
jgi:cobalt-zinc-cadmium efflux system outer membrane protein